MPFGLFQQKVSSTTSYGLTQLGKQKAENFEAEGPKFDVLTVLDEHGPSTINDISQDAHLNPMKVKIIVKTLIKNGYVQPVGGE